MNNASLQFVDAAVDYGPAFDLHDDVVLIFSSFIIAAIASSAAMLIGDIVRNGLVEGRSGKMCLWVGAMVMGLGAWVIHFTGMLVMKLPVPVIYDVNATAVSIVPVILAARNCMAVVSRDRISALRTIVTGIVMGIGIAATHYIAMAGVRVDAVLHYAPSSFVLSFVIGASLAVAALYVSDWAQRNLQESGNWVIVFSGASMGLAITAAHYTGMWAARFYPSVSTDTGSSSLDETELLVFVAIAVLIIIGMMVAAVLMARRLSAGNLLRLANAKLEQQTAALTISEARLLEAQRIAKVGSWEVDLTTNEVWWSRETFRIFGEDPDTFELTHDVFLQRVHPDDRAKVTSFRYKAIDTGRPVRFEYRIMLPDGSTKILLTRSEVETDAQGRPVRLAGTNNDITDRKKIEEALRESEAKYRMIADTAHEGIWLLAADRSIKYSNKRMGKILGYTPEELIGASTLRFLTEDARKESAFRIKRRKAGVTEQYDLQLIHKDGSVIWVSISATPITNDKGLFDGALLMISDITARRKLEEQLGHSQKMEAVGQLTGGIAHDFNNLLAIIIGNLQLLEEDVQHDENLAEPIRIAIDAGFRGADLTRRLLAFSRRQLLAPKVILISRLVSAIEPLLRRTLGENVTLNTATIEDLWLTEVDPSQLENAIVNLGINSRDAMPNGGELHIETSNSVLNEGDLPDVKAGEYVLLQVSDSGTGIGKNVLPHVFEPFFSTKEVGKGSGLGLSMVYGFVKQSNGDIRISSEDGHGTTIDIYLPRARSGTEETSETTISKASIPSGYESILIVEDDVTVRKITVELLTSLGYRVLQAASGAEALTILDEQEDIQLLFTDIVMPGGMLGTDLARHASQRFPGLKVLFTSGYHNTDVSTEGLLKQGSALLNKPYRKHQLAQKVREVLDGD